MAVDKYCYVSLRRLPPFFEHTHRIVYSRIETVKRIAQIEHPAVRAVLQETQVGEGIELHHDGDLPARSGMGSSSAFTVGLLHAVSAMRGRMMTKRFLAEEAIRIEQRVIGENVGSQDQVWAAFGGINRVDFHRDGQFTVAPIILPPGRERDLLSHLMLFYTGLSRNASEIAGEVISQLPRHQDHLHRFTAMVDEAQAVITDPRGDLAHLGELLHEAWTLKRTLAPGVSTDLVDDIYAGARAVGATGGKLLGAGGGGFVLLFVPPNAQPDVRRQLHRLIEVKFGIDRGGSTVVVYQPNGLSSL